MEANRNGNLVYSEEPPMFISHENESFYEEPLSEYAKSEGGIFPGFSKLPILNYSFDSIKIEFCLSAYT